MDDLDVDVGLDLDHNDDYGVRLECTLEFARMMARAGRSPWTFYSSKHGSIPIPESEEELEQLKAEATHHFNNVIRPQLARGDENDVTHLPVFSHAGEGRLAVIAGSERLIYALAVGWEFSPVWLDSVNKTEVVVLTEDDFV